MNKRRRKKAAKKRLIKLKALWRRYKDATFLERYAMTGVRMGKASLGHAIQTWPREFKAEFVGVDYARMESRVVMTVHPGADGIGPDVYQGKNMEEVARELQADVIRRHERQVEAAFGMWPIGPLKADK